MSEHEKVRTETTKLLAEAKQQHAESNDVLAKQADEANRIREEARTEGAQIVAEARERATAEASRITDQAQAQIAAERAQAATQLKGEVGTLATTLASKIVGESLDASVSPRGLRILGKIPRLPGAIVERLVDHFGSLQRLLAAGIVLLVVAAGQIDDEVSGLDEQAPAVGVRGQRRAVAG